MGRPTERRLDEAGANLFARAVVQAASIATQNVAAIHRRRLVTQAFIAGVLAGALVGVVLYFAFRSEAISNARSNATYDCQLVQQLSVPLADFVRTDAKLRVRQQALTTQDQTINRGFSKIFSRPNLQRIEGESQALNQLTTDYWQQSVVPRLSKISAATCSQHIR